MRQVYKNDIYAYKAGYMPISGRYVYGCGVCL